MDALASRPRPKADTALPVRPTREEAEAAVRVLIGWIGDDPNREGLVQTPRRVVSSFEELYAGYGQDPAELLSTTFKDVGGYGEMVLIRDIPFFSACEHHMLPFTGKVHIAYYPTDGVIGLSKLARVVDLYARRLQTQETMTAQIAEALEKHLGARGVAVMIEAEHLCMSMRGVHKAGASTMTSRFSGVFRDDAGERDKFLNLVRPTYR